MERERKPDGFSEIEEVIREEKARAFEAFRKADFSARLDAKIRQIGTEDAPRVPLFRRLAPSLIAALAVLAGGVLVVSRVFISRPAKGETIFEVYLRQASNLESLALSKTAPDMARQPKDSGPALLSDELIKFFEQARKRQSTPPEIRQPDNRTKPAPRLTLKERMEILFKEQVIQRFFELYYGKNKEVGEWHADSLLYPA